MKFSSYLLCIVALWSVKLQAQEHHSHNKIQGTVMYLYQETANPLENITVYWQEMPSMETTTDPEGRFSLMYHEGLYHLVVEKEGFISQTIAYQGEEEITIYLELEEELPSELSTIEVRSRLSNLSIDKESAMLQFNISDKELAKAACCNLSESFETNPTVDVAYNDAVTGTKEIKLLGLNQRYTAFGKDNLRDLRGLATFDGLEFIPGKWISSVQLAKGTPSVTTSHDAITGMINTNLYQFEDHPESRINLYINQNARAETNVVSTQALNDKWSNAIFLHGSGRFDQVDNNKDGFLDAPTGHQLNLSNTLRYNDLAGKGWTSFLGFQLMTLEKTAGQLHYRSKTDRLTTNAYGVENETQRISVWNKIGKVLNQSGRSFGFMQQYIYHQQNQTFGIVPYDGKEISYQAKIVYEDILGNTNHAYKIGAQFLYDQFNENFDYQLFKRNERDLGLFAEYEFSVPEKLKLMLGTRVDFHSLAGTQFSPKVHIKYIPGTKTNFRFTLGRAFRTANIFEENQKYWASQRQLNILATDEGKVYGLEPESAWNFGLSWSQDFRLFSRKSNIIIDFFRTEFSKQVIADADYDAQQLLLYNVGGKSIYNSFQTMLTTTLTSRFDLRLAYKYYDTEIDYIDVRRSAPMIAKHRGFLNLEYNTAKNEGRNWSFDTTLQWVGKMRLPNTKSNPEPFQRSSYSENYLLINAQVARNFNENLRMYLGAENLTSYTQDNPIIEVENPFGNYFDASMIYAPVMKANLYLGVDFNF